jgi:3-hydroxybutyryl-CoA dehydrogenase
MQIQNIFVIGAGTMGSGIAQVAATSGYQVSLMDVIPEQLERAHSTITRSVDKLLSKGTISEEQRAAALRIP